ncbi:MAG: hypothetical protein AAGK17_04550 [Pseudomonadota bacterium]
MHAVFRCDATTDIGFGHLSRCLALGEAFALHGLACTFAGKFARTAKDQIEAAGFKHIGLKAPVNGIPRGDEETAINCKHPADFVVVDSYRADVAYLKHLRNAGFATLVIDDFCKLEAYPCDAILNFTWEAPTLDYPKAPALILGHNYLLARRKLVERRKQSVERQRGGELKNLFVAIGGSDPKGLALRIVRVLGAINRDVVVRVLGQASAELSSAVECFAKGSAVIAPQPDLSEQFLWSDVAITGGGLIKYESAYMGVPAAAIAQNEGQDGETKVFSGAGLVFDLGLADTVSDDELADRLNTFLSDAAMRANMARLMRSSFVADPSGNAAKAILEALER